jgi:hypothetical protein
VQTKRISERSPKESVVVENDRNKTKIAVKDEEKFPNGKRSLLDTHDEMFPMGPFKRVPEPISIRSLGQA